MFFIPSHGFNRTFMELKCRCSGWDRHPDQF